MVKTNKMKEVNQRIFLFIAALKQTGVIEFESDFCDAIGMKKQNLNNIKNGLNFFTVKHINSMISKFNLNPKYAFGLEKNMFNNLTKITENKA